VAPALSRVVRTADAIVLTGSSVIGDCLALIVVMANKAKKAARVLRGAKPASIPIEALPTFDVILNLRTAKAAGIEVPGALRREATRVIEQPYRTQRSQARQ
jgi:ABC-type uncharacterized transport system substrate-binding protein